MLKNFWYAVEFSSALTEKPKVAQEMFRHGLGCCSASRTNG
jgi:hypothetical protein